MNTDLMKLEPMTKDQLEYIKKEIKKNYLYLISQTAMVFVRNLPFSFLTVYGSFQAHFRPF